MISRKSFALAFAVGLMGGYAFPNTPLPKESKKVIARKRAKYHLILDSAGKANAEVHLAIGELGYYGDDSSIPHLISSLSLFPDRELSGNAGMICTQAHCVQTLEKFTGVKVGVSFSSWKTWWDKSHPGQPLPNRTPK